ncbi:MAG: hypothetical protein HPY53_14110 [Brevinematales bacterium]|nr:hypothetical protein [Brevinematales bacterium]
MKKLIILLAIFTFSASEIIFAELDGQKNIRITIILPFHNLSSPKNLQKTEKYSVLIWKSLFNFLKLVPSLDIPAFDEIETQKWNSGSIVKIATKYKAAFVIYGETFISNDQLIIQLSLWDSVKGKKLLKKEYMTDTTYDLIDTLDLIVNDTVSAILNTPIEIATLYFKEIKAQDKILDIFINGKKIASVNTNQYSEKIKVLAGYLYKMEIKLQNGKILSATDAVPEPGETVVISYEATPATGIIIPTTENELIYKDKSGFQFNYPKDWKKGSNPQIATPYIAYSSQDDFAAFSVSLIPMKYIKMSTVEHVNETLRLLGVKNLLNADEIYPPISMLEAVGAEEGSLAIYDYKVQEIDLLISIFMFSKGDNHYMCIKSVAKKYLNIYDNVLDQMLNSFKITGK